MNVLRYRLAKEYLDEMLFLQRKAFKKNDQKRIVKRQRVMKKGQKYHHNN